MIFDTHTHAISSDNQRYPRIDEGRDLALPANPAEAVIEAMDRAGVARALMVQAFFTYGFDNKYVADASAQYPDRLTGIAVLDPLAPETPGLLNSLARNHGIRGVRLMNDRGRTPVCIDDPRTFDVWRVAQELDAPLSIAALLGDVAAMHAPLEHFPGVRASLDHIWGLDFKSAPIDELLAPILSLADYPYFQLKVAPTNSFAAREAGLDPVDLYRRLVDRFGAERILWGSNYPVRWGSQGTLAERVIAERAIWSFLSPLDRDKVFGGNAAALWPSPIAAENTQ